MINKDWGGGAIFRFCAGGGHNCYERGHRAHGGPPTRENPRDFQQNVTGVRMLGFTPNPEVF